MVIVTIYPILWVLTVAFSGQQALMFVDLPADPSPGTVCAPSCTGVEQCPCRTSSTSSPSSRSAAGS